MGQDFAIHHNNLVVVVQGAAPVVAAHQKRLSSFSLLSHDPQQVIPCRWIDGAAGFIEQQDVCLLHQRPRQQNPLLLASGEMAEAA